jgi:8-oxo-dGTP pyrophosphatase MutT (NUDIX family)
MQKYKIFVNNGLIIFGDLSSQPPLNLSWSDFQIVKSESIKNIVDNIESFQEIGNYLVETKDPEKAFNEFANYFKIMQAAGGLVINDKDQLLMIHRFEHWDFPKGKVEKGEGIEEAAIREVMEETGIINVHITQAYPNTYHIYNYFDKWILKETFWYLMHSDFSGELSPQLEEDIVAAKWVPIDFLGEYILDSYAALQDLVNTVQLIR